MKKSQLTSISLDSAIRKRETIRELTGGIIPKSDLDLLVWAAYGNTHKDSRLKMRPAPSAGATYPVSLYLVIGRIETMKAGIYRFDTKLENLVRIRTGDYLDHIRDFSWDQDFISQSCACFVLVYDPAKIEKKYGRDSRKYGILECGHIAQNILLAASAMGLGSVPVGAFSVFKMRSILKLSKPKEPIYMISVGTID